MNDEYTHSLEKEALEQASRLTESFVSGSAPIAGEKLRKITQADLVILAIAGNRFVNGFSAIEREQAERGNVIPFLIDLLQWREVCRASEATREAWLSDNSSFKSHVVRCANTAPANVKVIGQMFLDVLRAYQEIQESEISVQETKQAKGQHKKKVPSRRK